MFLELVLTLVDALERPLSQWNHGVLMQTTHAPLLADQTRNVVTDDARANRVKRKLTNKPEITTIITLDLPNMVPHVSRAVTGRTLVCDQNTIVPPRPRSSYPAW